MAGTFPLVRRLVAVALLLGASAGERDHRLLADQQAGADGLTSITTETPSTTEPATSVSSTTTTQRAPAPPPTIVTTIPPAGGSVVTRVVDGDTIEAQVDGRTEGVRIIGINSPERGECLADEAGRWLRARVGGKAVRLVVDESDRDQYDRLLRYVELDGADVGVEIVRAGLAIARRYPPDTARAEALEAAQREAQAATVGMWSPGACGAATTAELVISEIRFDAAGDDNHNLNDEWVRITNRGSTRADLTDWVLKDESASHRYHFPAGFGLDAGAAVTVRSGCGTDTATDLYWCNTATAVWNNSGDTAFLLDPAGNVVDSRAG